MTHKTPRATNKRVSSIFMAKQNREQFQSMRERFGYATRRYPKYRSCQLCTHYHEQLEYNEDYYFHLDVFCEGGCRPESRFHYLLGKGITWKTGCRSWKKEK